MKHKVITGIMLTLLLIGTLTLAFNIQPVRTNGTIYITSDYTFTHNIYEPIVVLADNIVIDGNGYTLQGTGSGTGIDLSYRNNVTIKNIEIKTFNYGIYLSGSSNNIISGNNITNGDCGILLEYASENSIYRNNITNHQEGILLLFRSNRNIISGNNITTNNRGIRLFGANSEMHEECEDNIISGNNLTNYEYSIRCKEALGTVISGNTISTYGIGVGISLWHSRYSLISENNIANNDVGIHIDNSYTHTYHNNFVDNTNHTTKEGRYTSHQSWDDGYPSGGNYWSDYNGVDEFSGPNQDKPGSDGIGDTSHVVGTLGDELSWLGQDNYPLMKPWSPVVSATIDVDPDTLNLYSKGEWITSYVELPEGYNVSDIDIYSVRLNDTFPVSLLPNTPEPVPIEIGDYDNDTIPDLMVKYNRTEVASWVYIDLGIQYGNVTLAITGELSDGTPFEGTDIIKVLFPGDADSDGAVTSHDLSIFAGCYGTSIENPSYDPRADFNEDGCINSEDLSIIAGNYGKTAS